MVNISENIESLLPQSAPFVMIDKLFYSDETITRSGLLIQEDNIFVVDGELREPGLVENIAQTVAVRAGYISRQENNPVLVGYIGSVNNLEILALPKTGNELVTEITIENQIFDITIISGKVFCNDQLIAQCQMKIFINKVKNPQS
jgi:predicted hotdog family 3-hydroxylacyl-ACP dehydratase